MLRCERHSPMMQRGNEKRNRFDGDYKTHTDVSKKPNEFNFFMTFIVIRYFKCLSKKSNQKQYFLEKHKIYRLLENVLIEHKIRE